MQIDASPIQKLGRGPVYINETSAMHLRRGRIDADLWGITSFDIRLDARLLWDRKNQQVIRTLTNFRKFTTTVHILSPADVPHDSPQIHRLRNSVRCAPAVLAPRFFIWCIFPQRSQNRDGAVGSTDRWRNFMKRPQIFFLAGIAIAVAAATVAASRPAKPIPAAGIAAPSTAGTRAATSVAQTARHFTLVIHGGEGDFRAMPPEDVAAERATLKEAMEAGYRILNRGGTSLDAVEAAIRIMEIPDTPTPGAAASTPATASRNSMPPSWTAAPSPPARWRQ